jgi:hypothetical protein
LASLLLPTLKTAHLNLLNITQHPPAKDGGLVLWTESPDTGRTGRKTCLIFSSKTVLRMGALQLLIHLKKVYRCVQISMDGKGAWRNNVFIERL